ncbi:hypothetical protein R3P38DRAFT_1713631 [Favolaschia claudopus]|uniref:C2H2-type domain-containing protein n=1 Tax=Favolaschia claudopus TaxID=2862362 RepID=A0AAW0A9N0_9AGAR
MIALSSVVPPPLPPLAMSSSSGSRRSHDRPVLPPIGDLFRELSSRVPPESPAMTLARLRVSDEEGSRLSYSHQPHSRPSSTRPPSRSSTDPYSQPTRAPSRSSHAPHASHPDYQTAPSRTMSYDRATYPPHSSSPHLHQASGLPAYDPRNDPRAARPPIDYNSPVMQPYYARPGDTLPPTISTGFYGPRVGEDDRTPVARFQPSGMLGFASPDASTSGAQSKYECTYCGKGFTRPSSLKIHLNSHTGEKPFVCPVDGCGRSFSVLSNMRRHARVHTTPLVPPGSEASAGVPLSSASHHASSSGRWGHRRNSSASASSSSSRRSHSVSSDEEEDYDRGMHPYRK